MESYERRLPVYLLLDCSESMVGEGIDAVNRGMRQVLLDLHSDPHALETVWMSIITFDSNAKQVLPLTELHQVRAPKLKVRPGTNLGGALRLLSECIKREVRTHSATSKGDWKPMVFLLTDGDPTDEWEAAARDIKMSKSGGQALNLIAIGCGPDADPLVLMSLTDTVLMMSDRENDFRSLFAWISSSLSVTSQAIVAPQAGGAVSLAKIPEELSLAPQHNSQIKRAQKFPSQLFLVLRCCEKKDLYLTRHHLAPSRDHYIAVGNHAVDEDYLSGSVDEDHAPALQISSQNVVGIIPCPYCDNHGVGGCPVCQNLFCAPDDGRPVECPWCGAMLSPGGEGDFAMSGRVG